jgi:hypothetical protein
MWDVPPLRSFAEGLARIHRPIVVGDVSRVP